MVPGKRYPIYRIKPYRTRWGELVWNAYAQNGYNPLLFPGLPSRSTLDKCIDDALAYIIVAKNKSRRSITTNLR